MGLSWQQGPLVHTTWPHRLQLEPGQRVVPHGVDRDLTTGEVAPGRKR